MTGWVEWYPEDIRINYGLDSASRRSTVVFFSFGNMHGVCDMEIVSDLKIEKKESLFLRNFSYWIGRPSNGICHTTAAELQHIILPMSKRNIKLCIAGEIAKITNAHRATITSALGKSK